MHSRFIRDAGRLLPLLAVLIGACDAEVIRSASCVNSRSCDVHARCVVEDGTAACRCLPGFSGDGQVCTDIDECGAGTGQCPEHTVCGNLLGSYECNCAENFTPAGDTCVHVDECAQDHGGCDPLALCVNTEDSHECHCPKGYEGDGRTCEDVNECNDPDTCSVNADCVNLPGSFLCTCRAGYVGDGQICIDIDECATGADDCPPDSTCVNTEGSYRCSCPPGFILNGNACVPVAPRLLSSGMTHTCSIRKDGSLWCAGGNDRVQLGDGTTDDRGVPVQVAPGSVWRTVATGVSNTCGVRTDGSLWCWSLSTSATLNCGIARVPCRMGTDSDWVSISIGDAHKCGLKTDGSLWCWGTNTDGQADGTTTTQDIRTPSKVPALPGNVWVAVTAGPKFNCGLQSDATLWCWGDNTNGQLGFGATSVSTPHLPNMLPGSGYNSVDTGYSFSCATRFDGTLWCWGANPRGELGNGTTSQFTLSPISRVGNASTWTSVAVAGPVLGNHACALQSDGSLWCWGWNALGQLGTNSHLDSTVPVRVGTATDWISVELGMASTCGRKTDGTVYCWGSDRRGQLGLGVGSPATPRLIANGSKWQSTIGAEHSSFGLRADGAFMGWGEVGFGPVTTLNQLPTLVHPGPWTQVDVSQNYASDFPYSPPAMEMFACAIDPSHHLFCWGSNLFGQVGDQSWLDRPAPVPIGTDLWDSVSTGWNHTCGIKQDGTGWCWGDNAVSQLGIVGLVSSLKPAEIIATKKWRQIYAGNAHTLAIDQSGALWGWGGNGIGELGDGTKTNRPTPVQIGSDTNWRQVSATSRATCATRTDNTLWCWGSGDVIGNPIVLDTSVPLQIGGSWASVATSHEMSCGIQTDGSLWCWGTPPTTHGYCPGYPGSPTRIGVDNDWVSVSPGTLTTCAVKSDQSLWCFGDQTWGQRGDGTAFQLTPVLSQY